MKRVLSIFLALLLAFSLGLTAYASGEASGEASGGASGEASGGASGEASGGASGEASSLPAELAELPTIEAEPWLMVSDERVGLEGPAFDDEGNFYVCSTGLSYAINYILKIDPDKNITTIYEGELSPLGLAFREDGRLFVVCREGQLLTMDSDGGDVTSVTPTYEGKTLSLNDLTFNAYGDLFVTDWQGSVAAPTGGIYLLTAESGYQEAQLVAGELAGPNGISLSPDGNTLWAGITHAGTVARIDLTYDGETLAGADLTIIYENTGNGEPDSNKTDAAGNVYQAFIQAGRILVFNSDGEPIANIVIPEDQSSLRMSSNLAIKSGTTEGYMLSAGFGAGSWIFTFEALAEGK